jgi:hypothetical protein
MNTSSLKEQAVSGNNFVDTRRKPQPSVQRSTKETKMTKKFSELRAKLTLEARAQAEELAQSLLLADEQAGNRYDFDRFLKLVPEGKPIGGDEIIGN